MLPICVSMMTSLKIHNFLISSLFLLKLSLTCFSHFPAFIKSNLISGWTSPLTLTFAFSWTLLFSSASSCFFGFSRFLLLSCSFLNPHVDLDLNDLSFLHLHLLLFCNLQLFLPLQLGLYSIKREKKRTE